MIATGAEDSLWLEMMQEVLGGGEYIHTEYTHSEHTEYLYTQNTHTQNTENISGCRRYGAKNDAKWQNFLFLYYIYIYIYI